MAKTVATLGVSLTAKIGDFEKGFKKAARIASRFSSDLAGHVGTIVKYGAAVTGIAAAATSALVKQQLEAVDATSKLSRTLGISTENLVGYQRAAELAGVDSDALAKAVFKLNKSTEAAFTGMSGDQRLLAVADTYQTIGSAAQRAQYLTKLFGKAGLELGSLFESGSAGILQARKETEKLRTSFTALEGIRVENALDAFSTAQQAISGMAQRIGIELAPLIQVAANRLTNFATGWNVAGDAYANFMNYVGESIDGLYKMFQTLRFLWNTFSGVVKNFFNTVILMPIRAIVETLDNALSKMGINTLSHASGALAALTKAFSESTDESAAAMQDAFDKISANGSPIKKYFQGIVDEAEKIKDLEGAVVNLGNATGGAASGGSSSVVATAVGKITEDVGAAIQSVKDAIAGMSAEDKKAYIGNAIDQLKERKSYIEDASSAFARQIDLSRVAIGGVSASSVGDGSKSVVEQLKKTNSYLSVMASNGRAVVI